jgi:hypothetical protein
MGGNPRAHGAQPHMAGRGGIAPFMPAQVMMAQMHPHFGRGGHGPPAMHQAMQQAAIQQQAVLLQQSREMDRQKALLASAMVPTWSWSGLRRAQGWTARPSVLRSTALTLPAPRVQAQRMQQQASARGGAHPGVGRAFHPSNFAQMPHLARAPPLGAPLPGARSATRDGRRDLRRDGARGGGAAAPSRRREGGDGRRGDGGAGGGRGRHGERSTTRGGGSWSDDSDVLDGTRWLPALCRPPPVQSGHVSSNPPY